MKAQMSTSFRPDIEGLRAIAIGLVVLYHAKLSFVPGGFVGVDVFFVISGFLITSLLLREAQRTGRVSLRRFYARRAKRLLPAAVVVFVVSAIGTMFLIDGSDRRVFGGDIVAAAAYLVNWRFAQRSLDYLAEGEGASPVLHFWSLSVEEQFYFVWPFLVIIALVVAKRMGVSMRRTMLVALAAVGVPSLVYSVLYTASSPASAFFVTTTRMWELAVGAAVALAAPMLARLPKAWAVVLGVAGCVAIAAAAFGFSTQVAWPGALALVPVLGSAAVIAAGVGHGNTVVARLLGVRPMVWLGGLSYSLYLWHWPVLIFGAAILGPLSTAQSAVLVVASVIPAFLSLRFVENPVRYSQRLARGSGMTLVVGALLTLVGVVAGLIVMVTSSSASAPQPNVVVLMSPDQGETPTGTVGAQALGNDPEQSEAGTPRESYDIIVPAPASAPDDVPEAYDLGCQAQVADTEPTVCTTGASDASVRIAALGDSKMLQYYESLDVVGKSNGWQFDFMTKSSCAASAATPTNDGRAYTECTDFNDNVNEALLADPPDAIITTQANVFVRPGDGEPRTGSWQAEGLAVRWQEWIDAGIPVIVLLDYPRPTDGLSVYRCMERNADSALQCAYDRAEGDAASAGPDQRLALDAVPEATPVDITRYVCPQESCAPVIGDVLILRQGSHMTNTYAVTLAPVLSRELQPIVTGITSP